MANDVEKTLRKIYKLKSDGKSDKALEFLNDELSKNPRVYEYIMEQVDILFSMEREQEALRTINRAWNGHPNRRPEILGYLQQIKELYPDLPRVDSFLVLKFLAHRDLKAARDNIRFLDDDGLARLMEQFRTKASRFERIAMPGSVGGEDVLPFYGLLIVQELNAEWAKVSHSMQTIARLAPRELDTLQQEIDYLLTELPDVLELHQTRAYLMFQLVEWDGFITEIQYLIGHKNGLTAELVKLVHQSVEQNPNRWELKHALCHIEFQQGNVKDALKLLNQTAVDQPESRPAFIEWLQSLIRQQQNEPAFHEALARLYLMQNQTDEAVEEMSQLLSLQPRYAKNVIQYCRQFLDTNPAAIKLNYPLGDALIVIERVNDAIQAYTRIAQANSTETEAVISRLKTVLEQHSDNISAHNALAFMLYQSGEYDHAAITLHHLFHVEPKTKDDVIRQLRTLAKQTAVQSNAMLRMLQIHLDAGELEPALELAEQLVAMDNQQLPNVLIELDHFVQNAPRQAGAVINFYRLQLEIAPDDPTVRFAMAEALFYQESYAEAALVYKAVALLDESRVDQAIAGLNRILVKEENFLPALRELLEIHLEYDQIERAVTILEEFEAQDLMPLKDVVKYLHTIIEKRPQNEALRLTFARIYLKNDLLEHTIQVCDEAIAVLPETSHGHFYLIKGQCLTRNHTIGEATQHFHQAYQLNREFANPIIEGLNDVLEINPIFAPARKLLAGIFYKEERLEAAVAEYLELARIDESVHPWLVDLFDQILNIEITNPRIALGVGDLYVLLADVDNALRYYMRTIQLDPTFLDEIPNRYEELLKDYPDHAPLHLAYANALVRLNQFDRALVHLDQAYILENRLQNYIVGGLKQMIELEPANCDARQRLVDIFIYDKAFSEVARLLTEILERDDLRIDFILQKCELILSMDEKCIPIYWVLTKTHLARQNLSAGLDNLQTIIELDRRELDDVITFFESLEPTYGEDVPFLFAFGDALALQGDYTRAQEIYWAISWKSEAELENVIERMENLIQYQQRSATLHNLIGELYLRAQKFETAKDFFIQGLKMVHGGDLLVELYLNLSKVYSLLGDDKQAKMEFARARKFDPQHQVIYQKIRQIRETGWQHQLVQGEVSPAERIQLHIRLRQFDDALAVLNRTERTPEIEALELELLLHLKQLHLMNEKAAKLKVDQRPVDMLKLLAHGHAQLDDTAARIAVYQQLRDREPNNEAAQRQIEAGYQKLVLNKLNKRATTLVNRTRIR